MTLPLIVLICITVLYLVGLAFSCAYFFRFFRTRDKCSLWVALLGLLGIPGLVLLSSVVFIGIAKYTGHSLPVFSGGDPCGMLYPCRAAAQEFRDKMILVATGAAYLGCAVFSMASFFKFYRTKEKCSLWAGLLLLLGLPGILVLYGLFDSLVLNG
ncbi:MAG: hypothetical protein A2X35_01455 [Elusimicrobia bacterium GWA2_61_42]|nr:MAG: hypothetical protein A2X35_01455 [Elusimicrobia bacterium GWA2_61_42]OGR76814.1 MAG: hypothetical protein A2X38_11630 [Elusimicrobia bacterium GWC2_61_25]